MHQIIHIFKKDVRRFSFEASLALVLLAFYTWFEPYAWSQPGWDRGGPNALYYVYSGWVGFALVMGWTIVLVRLIQEEAPAGDRQFWVTRAL